MSSNPTHPTPQAAIHALLRDERFEEADALLSRLENPPLALLLIHSQVAQKLGDFPRMLQLAERAAHLERNGSQAALRLVECQIYAGESRQALAGLRTLRKQAGGAPDTLHRIAKLYIHCARHDQARACHEDALRAEPRNADFMYDLATSCVAAGDFARAGELFDEVIRRQPDNWIAWQNRSNLRKQTPESNHVGELKAALHNLPQPGPAEVPLCYTLAKEYEDLGDARRSIKYLQMGAARRREALSYRVSDDVATMRRIRQVFTAERLADAQPAPGEPGPIFVLGLPRSGTTLVDRILASHSQVSSLGEVNNLAFSVIGASGYAPDKNALVEKSAQADFVALGEMYLKGTRGFGEPGPWLVDKTPLNFLYLGLIRLALPGAKVIHLRRNPMDSCYAMYKTLFRAGFPFSYDLEDLGRYYLAYRKLMNHWREVLPGFILDVDYETLVTHQEKTSRDMLRFCGLDWEDAVLDFHRNRGVAATASAAQVRQPIYTSSVGRWKQYQRQLQPLADYLTLNGVCID